MSPTLAVSPLSPERACASSSSLISIAFIKLASDLFAGRSSPLDELVQFLRASVALLADGHGVLAEHEPEPAQVFGRLTGGAQLLDGTPHAAARVCLRRLEVSEAADRTLLVLVHVVSHVNDEHGVAFAQASKPPSIISGPASASQWNPTTTSECVIFPSAMSEGISSSGARRTTVCSVPPNTGSPLNSTPRARNV